MGYVDDAAAAVRAASNQINDSTQYLTACAQQIDGALGLVNQASETGLAELKDAIMRLSHQINNLAFDVRGVAEHAASAANVMQGSR